MPLLIDKLLAVLVYPLGSALLLALVGLVLAMVGRRRLGHGLVLVAVAWLWAWSTEPVAQAITESLAGRFPPTPVTGLPRADAIVVLGGGLSPRDGDRLHPDLEEGADRVWHAARLHAADRAPRIVLSGGLVWPGAAQTEAAAMALLATQFGVPAEVLLLEDESRSTRENALNTAPRLAAAGMGRVLLVTSAMHMPRALAAFRAVGIDAVPAATDYGMPTRRPRALTLLPRAVDLDQSTRALHEILGLLVYRMRGWA